MFAGNEEFKKEFIEKLGLKFDTSNTIATKKLAGDFFKKSQVKTLEKQVGADIYDFSPDEIKKLLKALGQRNRQNLNPYLTILNKYIPSAIDAGLSKHNVNPLDTFTRMDYKETIISGEFEKYFTKDELKDALSTTIFDEKLKREISVPYQTQAIYILLYNGFRGKGHEDILKIEIQNFSKKDSTLFYNGNLVILEKWESDIIDKAIKQRYFEKESNGKVCSFEYAPTNYLIKKQNIYELKKDIGTLSKRDYKDAIDKAIDIMGRPFWNSTVVYASGVCYRMLQIKKEWTHAEAHKYLKLNKIPVTHQRAILGIKILKDKIEALSK